MKNAYGRIGTTLIVAVMIWLICSPVTPEFKETQEPTLLILSLEEVGRRSAVFSGAPIEAIIELDKDTSFSNLYWHTGQGDPQFSDTLLKKRSKRFSVQLVWKKYPLVKDSAGNYIDTVFVSMGGGLKKSNKVTIQVTNLPVIADSCRFNSVFFPGTDPIWYYTFTDTVARAKRYALRFYAHDLDGRPHLLQVLENKGLVYQNSTKISEMEYEPPEGDFTDTITFVAYDQKGSQTIRRLVINRISPNIPAFIDSVRIKTTVVKGGGVLAAGFDALDTLKLQVFAHDSLGEIKKVSWVSQKNRITADSSQFKAVWLCTSAACADTTSDTSFVIDTITVRVVDNRGDTTVKRIEIYKGKINAPPQIKVALFGEKSIAFTDTVAAVQALGGKLYTIKMNVVDPEKDSVTVTWETSNAGRLSSRNDSSVIYRAPMVLDTDTVTVTISDGKSKVVRHIVITIDDVGPIIDSIAIKDTVIISEDSLLYYEAIANDTLLLLGFAYDRDPLKDSQAFTWDAGKPERFIKRQSNAARYVLPAKDINDTIIFTVQDGTAQTVRKIVLFAGNNIPVIDSIYGDRQVLKKLSQSEYIDIVQASDTIDYEVFARDPEGGSLEFEWSVADSMRLIGKTGIAIKYLCDSTKYKDTITVKAIDSLDAFIQKRIILQIDTAATP